MQDKEDFSWENGKIKNGATLGKIVSIPVQDDSEIENTGNMELNDEDQPDLDVDEFKKKMSEKLSMELNRNK